MGDKLHRVGTKASDSRRENGVQKEGVNGEKQVKGGRSSEASSHSHIV
jgi:hypothetical protein